jgi:hypothetical protein
MEADLLHGVGLVSSRNNEYFVKPKTNPGENALRILEYIQFFHAGPRLPLGQGQSLLGVALPSPIAAGARERRLLFFFERERGDC